MSADASTNIRLTETFNAASAPPERLQRHKGLKTRAFAIKFTDEERAYLEELAGNLPLGTYCRRQLLGEREEKRQITRKPRIDDKKLGEVLAMLGQCRNFGIGR